MGLALRAVRLRVVTEGGTDLGTAMRFYDGLNVIQAVNSRGKTQVLQGIAFALGLEAMFGSSHASPLGSAMTSEVELPGGTVEPVASSWVAIELENSDGDTLVVQRFVKHPTIRPNLVRVWTAPVLTMPVDEAPPATTMHVRESGSAQQERGFHRTLAEFAGWDLPTVPRYTGGDSPLYIEVFFPYLYADQRSWNSAGPRVVSQYQLREPSRRSVEFLLGLKGPAAAARRAELETDLANLRSRWESTARSLAASADLSGVRMLGVPDVPAGATRRAVKELVATQIIEPELEVLVGAEWVDFDSAFANLSAAAQDRPVAVVGQRGEPLLAEELAAAEAELAIRRATAALVDQNLGLLEAQVDALDQRIGALEEERRRYADLRTLVRLGDDDSQHAHALADEDCPTCHQSLEAVEADDLGPLLGLEDTANLLAAELATAQQMRAEAARAQTSARSAHAAVAREVDMQIAQVRALRSDLIAPDDFPSEAEIWTRLAARMRTAELERVIEVVRGHVESLNSIGAAVVTARLELNSLPTESPDEDLRVLAALETSMREQLEEYGFASYAAEKIGLDEETLRPTRPGFDIDADVSASDVVRVKIAYLNALRETALEVDAPHPGLLILDEPRQHELDAAHFRAALARLGTSASGQVIVTSAASDDDLADFLDGSSANVVAVIGRVLRADVVDDGVVDALADSSEDIDYS